jgi:hypothetical protein
VCVCVQWSLGKKNKEKWRSPSLSRRPLWWVSAIKFICSVQHFLSLFFFLIWAFPRQPNGTKRTVDHEYTSKYVYNVLLHRWSANPAEM